MKANDSKTSASPAPVKQQARMHGGRNLNEMHPTVIGAGGGGAVKPESNASNPKSSMELFNIMEQLAQLKKLAESIEAKRKQREGIEAEMNRATVVITAADAAKNKLAELKAQRATLLADAFRQNKKADTKTIDAELTTAADAVRAEADRVTAATGAAAQLQSELAQVQDELDSLEREQRGLASQHCAESFKAAQAAYLKAVEVIGEAFVELHAAHEAQRRVTGHGSGDMRDMLRNYGSLRIFTPKPGTLRGWTEPEWLGGNGLERAAVQKAEGLLVELRGAGTSRISALVALAELHGLHAPRRYATALPVAGGSTVSNSNNMTVTVPNINITTSDPATAGQSVKEEHSKANRSAVRNGQSAVLQ